MPDEDPELVFQGWLDRHGVAVLKVARAYTRTVEDRQDLAQEILLQLWRSVPQFQSRAAASTWVYRVALNTALGWRRKEQRRWSRQAAPLDVDTVPAAGPDGSQTLADRELVERLYDALHRLSQADVALVLLYLDGLSYREMAEVLGITESNVGVRLNRAKKELSEQMKGGSDES